MTNTSPSRRAERVLIVIGTLYFGAGGMEKTAANLANHLAANGRSVTVMCRGSAGRQPLYPVLPEVQHLWGDFSPDWMHQTALHHGADVIVAFYATAIEAPGVAALADTGIPVILHEGSNPQRVIETNWAMPQQITIAQATQERLALMSMCTRLRFTLPTYLDSLPDMLRADAAAFPNAFAPADPDDMELRSHEARNHFINIGGLKEVKNVIAAAQAFALIADQIPDWDFHIFSAQPRGLTTRDRLNSLIAHHKIQDRIKIFPPTDNIAREYGRAKIHVIASKEEGLPNCIAEASRHGLPSIGFACCAGTNSMIEHGKNGLLADCGADEVENLAAQMLRLAHNDKEREAFGRAALDGSHIYDPDAVFQCWDKLIDDAYRDSPPREALLRRRYPDPATASQIRNVQRSALHSRPFPAISSNVGWPVLSIIIPIFNKAEHLAATLDTIRDNNYPAKQVILVNDASIDASPKIAQDYAREHGWQLLHHAQNQGLSAARNTGLRAAAGDIVQFWDADDLYDPQGASRIIEIVQQNGSDIATGLATRDGDIISRYAKGAMEIAATTFARSPEVFSTPSSCFKLYRRSFLKDNDLEFTPGLYMQDAEFNMRAFPLAERISATLIPLGEYVVVDGSGSRSFHPDRYASALAIEDVTRRFYQDHGFSALEAERQRHVLTTVLPVFVKRATLDYSLIDERTERQDIDQDFMSAVQQRLEGMSDGLLRTPLPNRQLHLALYAVREGYFAWACDLLARRRPTGFSPALLARNPAETRLTSQLAASLSRQPAQRTNPARTKAAS